MNTFLLLLSLFLLVLSFFLGYGLARLFKSERPWHLSAFMVLLPIIAYAILQIVFLGVDEGLYSDDICLAIEGLSFLFLFVVYWSVASKFLQGNKAKGAFFVILYIIGIIIILCLTITCVVITPGSRELLPLMTEPLSM